MKQSSTQILVRVILGISIPGFLLVVISWFLERAFKIYGVVFVVLALFVYIFWLSKFIDYSMKVYKQATVYEEKQRGK